MIIFTPKTISVSNPSILFFHFLVFSITLFHLPPSNSAPNATIPTNRNVSSLRFSDSVLDSTDSLRFPALMDQQQPIKKLRRVPHVFSKVLQLPLDSDADVSVEELPDYFRFVAEFDCLPAGNLRVLVVEPHPDIKKVLIRGGGGDRVLFDELDVHVWRVRLPDNAWPEAANAACRGGRLVVNVPKIGGSGGFERRPTECKDVY